MSMVYVNTYIHQDTLSLQTSFHWSQVLYPSCHYCLAYSCANNYIRNIWNENRIKLYYILGRA